MEKFDFSSAEYERFLKLCPFTDEEKKVLALRRHGKSIIEISMALSMSDRTVSRCVDSIKKKIAKEI
jgi:DNA-binding NarL/FixJ family response regulator